MLRMYFREAEFAEVLRWTLAEHCHLGPKTVTHLTASRWHMQAGNVYVGRGEKKGGKRSNLALLVEPPCTSTSIHMP